MKYTLSAILFLFLFGCHNSPTPSNTSVKKPDTPDSVPTISAKDTVEAISENPSQMRFSNCTRSLPKPIIDSTEYPNKKFQLSADSTNGTETVDFRQWR